MFVLYFKKVSIKNTHNELQKSLAWTCVQLHCEENIAARALAKEAEAEGHSNYNTAVKRAKHAIYSSQPIILFCDLSIDPGKVHKFNCTKKIPEALPPSFKANFVKIINYTLAKQSVSLSMPLLICTFVL